MIGKHSNQKKLEATMLSINTILHEIYKNKSSDEYKMKGDITKSPMYGNIEQMVADLSVLRGYPQSNVGYMKQLFRTLHLPVFKNMVKEFIMESNDKNTVFTSMFTIGYRLLVGELSRIFASTEATDKGIVYKPSKISKNEDAMKMIRLFNDQLEDKLNKYIHDLHKNPDVESPVNESYLLDVLQMEGFGFREIRSREKITDKSTQASSGFDPDKRVQPQSSSKKPDGTTPPDDEPFDPDKRVSFKSEEAETTDTADNTASIDSSDGEPVSTDSTNSDDSVQEGVISTIVSNPGAAVDAVNAVAGKIGPIVAGVAAIGGVVKMINSLLKGINPIADINFLLTESYDKKIEKLGAVSRMYIETKKAYEEYMKIPEAKRSKKVESKYIKNIEKYNSQMQTLSAEIEHFNQRAKKEAEDNVNDMEKKMPSGKVDTNPAPAGPSEDDDIQF